MTALDGLASSGRPRLPIGDESARSNRPSDGDRIDRPSDPDHMPPAHAPRSIPSRARHEAGFTLIEVLVTVLVLVVGLLGAFATLRASAHTTLTNRQRQVETSLAREVLEDAGSLSSTQLTSQALPAALQPLIPNSSVVSGGPGELRVQRGADATAPAYLLALTGCPIDDPSDGEASGTTSSQNDDSGCAMSDEADPGDNGPILTDPVADVEERVSVTIEPSPPVASGDAAPECPSASPYACVKESTLVMSHAPVVSALSPSGCASTVPVSCAAGQQLYLTVTTTTPATSISWFVNGGPPSVAERGGGSDPYDPGTGTTSPFTCTLPTLPGTYTISAQAHDAEGNAGPPSTLQIVVTPSS